MKKKSSLSRLFEYAGNYKYLTVLSWILSAVSAWIALVPFYYIWRIIKEVLAVAPDYSQAQNLKGYGWAAVGFALLSMIIYVGSLMCSHVSRTGRNAFSDDASYRDSADGIHGQRGKR